MSQFSVVPEDENITRQNEINELKTQQLINQIKVEQNILLAVVGGFVASLVAGTLWALVTFATGYQIGFMAIGVGIVVGFTVRFLGKGMTMPFGITGAFFAFLGCLIGNLLAVIISASQVEGIPLLSIISSFITDPGIIFQIFADTFSPMDLLFYGIAIYEGYKFSFRTFTEEEERYLETPVQTDSVANNQQVG